MEAQMAEPIQKLSAGSKNLSAGAAQVKAGTSGINAALNQGTTLEDGTQIPALNVLAAKTAADAQNLAQTIAAGSAVTTSAQDVANGNGGTQDALNTLYSVLNSLDPESAEYASVQAAISSLESDQAARTSAANELDSQIQTQSENVRSSTGNACGFSRRSCSGSWNCKQCSQQPVKRSKPDRRRDGSGTERSR